MGIEVEFQKALFSVLDTAKASMGVVGVYDFAPQAADGGAASAFPYITIGTIYPVALDTHDKNGFAVTCRIHTYSRSGGMMQCKTIQGAIYSLLHRADLTVTGFNSFLMLRSDSECLVMADQTIHGVCEYRALIEVS